MQKNGRVKSFHRRRARMYRMDEKYIRKVEQVLKRKTMGLAQDILKHINDYPRQSPATLNQNLDYSLSGIKNALVNLTDLGLIETQSRGVYIITNLGKHVLDNMPQKKPRTCPICNQRFKPMTDALWEINLFQHLISSMKHFLDPEEAKKYLDLESEI